MKKQVAACLAMLVVSATALAAASGLLAGVVARRVAGNRPTKDNVLIIRADRSTITFAASREALIVGEYGLVYGDGCHGRIGKILAADNDEVTREFTPTSGEIPAPMSRARWTGAVHASPDDVRGISRWEEIIEGHHRSWYIEPENASGTTWAIHLHGQSGSRASMLRGVEPCIAHDIHSLVPAYRTDSTGFSTLGTDETLDAEYWCDWAQRQGATQIFLFGWSAGGHIAIQVAQRRDVAGVVLVAPVTDWRSTIISNARSSKVPGVIARAAVAILASRRASKFIGIPAGVEHSLVPHVPSTCRRPETLLLHSHGDVVVSLTQSLQFADLHASHTKLVALPPAPHTLEWNRSPQAWEEAVDTWLDTTI